MTSNPSTTFQLPPQQILDEEYGTNIVRLNREKFHQIYPYQGTLFPNICLHVILGQLPNFLLRRFTIGGSELDLRIHSTILAPSGTNKGSGFNYMDKLCLELFPQQTTFKQLGIVNDSSLVGFADIVEQDGQYVRDDKYGFLHPSFGFKILAWGEGSDLLDAKRFNTNQFTMNILQKAMNPIGTSDNIVSKASGIGEVAYNTSVSLFNVTYRPDQLTSNIIKTGWLQRQIVLIHTPTLQQSENVSIAATTSLEDNTCKNVDISQLVTRLKIVNEFAKSATAFTIPDEIRKQIVLVQKSIYSVIKDSNMLVREKLAEFSRRWSVNILYTIIFHHCLLRLSNTVNTSDVLYAKDLILPTWVQFSAYIESALILDKRQYNQTIDFIREIALAYMTIMTSTREEWIDRSALINQLKIEWRLSRSATISRLSEFEEAIFTIKNTPITKSNSLLFDSDIEKSTRSTLKLKKEAFYLLRS